MNETPDKAELIETMRWSEQKFTFATAEAFEERRREPWLAPGTRNHRQTPTGIAREARSADDCLSVGDALVEVLQRLVVGRTIVGFEREPRTDEEWPQGANTVEITLDDGSRLVFDGWGHDASGVDTTYCPPPGGGSTPDGSSSRQG